MRAVCQQEPRVTSVDVARADTGAPSARLKGTAMTSPDERPASDPRRVRPYAMTGGRTRPTHDDLRADIALGLQQHRIHVPAGRDTAGPRLQRLRPADLAAIRGDRRIVRHVLRLERQHFDAARGKGPGEARHDQKRRGRLCSLEHPVPHFPVETDALRIGDEDMAVHEIPGSHVL